MAFPSWLSVDTAQGTGNGVVNYTALQNTGRSSRSYTATFQAEGVTPSVTQTIEQSGAQPFITMTAGTSGSITKDNTAGTITISGRSNCKRLYFAITTPDEDQSNYFTINNTSQYTASGIIVTNDNSTDIGPGVGESSDFEYSMVVSINANNSTRVRSSQVTIYGCVNGTAPSSADCSTICTIQQSCIAPYITISLTGSPIPAIGGSSNPAVATVSSNTSWSVS